MLIKTLPVGQLETNCYVVTNEETLECVVIDPGDETNTILNYMEDNKLKCKAILLTHTCECSPRLWPTVWLRLR